MPGPGTTYVAMSVAGLVNMTLVVGVSVGLARAGAAITDEAGTRASAIVKPMTLPLSTRGDDSDVERSRPRLMRQNMDPPCLQMRLLSEVIANWAMDSV